MQGYGTMAREAADQFVKTVGAAPTHVLIQAGVGSLAGAVQGYMQNRFAENPPMVTVVEATAAACLYKGAMAGDGELRKVEGDLNTIMAGLACGEPNTISWDILRNHTGMFLSCPDWVSARGMRMLGAPVKGDPRVISGESGAVGMGVVSAVMTDPAYAALKAKMGLNAQSRVLLFSTEGDTDPENYRRIVWDGAVASV